MSHDTSRHTIRADVTCSECGRRLRGALDARGRWSVRKHNRPDGTDCTGHWSTTHAPVKP